MPTIAIISRDFSAYANLLENELPTHAELIYCGDRVVTEATQAEILLAEPAHVAGDLDAFAGLKWLQSTWAGNQLMLQHPKRDYLLTGIKDVFGHDMAEFVMAYLLYFARNLSGFAAVQGQRKWRQDLLGPGLRDKSLGILGVGSIGKVVAKRAKAFDMITTGVTTGGGDCPYIDRYIGLDQLVKAAPTLDYLVSILPDTPVTRSVIDRQLLQALPSHCVVINVGRGGAVVDEDMVQALVQGQIQGAVLDVFRQEPLPETHPFWTTPNLHITHHTSAMSRPEHIAPIFLDNLARFMQQQPLKYTMDFQRGY